MKKTLLIVILFIAISCDNKQPNVTGIKTELPDPPGITITFLGNAGWEITDGKTVILIDPYISRIRRNYSETRIDSTYAGDIRNPISDNDHAVSDTIAINKHIKKADYILVHHSHRDHIMDVPYISLKTGATVIGHESTANILLAYGVDEQKIITVKGGEDYDFGSFSVKIIPSLHSPLYEKRYYDPRVFPKDKKAPLKIKDFVEGGSLAFLIRFGRHQVLTFGSMNYIEKELEGIHPDVVMVGALPSRKEIYDYAGRLMKVLNYPKIVFPTHWDNSNVPYEISQEKEIKQLESFEQEIKKASPNTKVIVPKYFEAIKL